MKKDSQSDVPGGWHRIALGQLVTFHRGHDLTVKDMAKGKYPVVGSNGIIGYHNDFKVKGPGVTVGRSGNLGKPFFVDREYWPHNTALYVSEFHLSDPYFVYYFLKTLDLGGYDSGSAVPTLNRNHIHTIEVIVPREVEEQKAIGRILSSLDSRIELNREMEKTLEAVGQAVFKRWFLDFEFPNQEGKPYKSSGGEMIESELGRIPVDWEVTELKEVVEIVPRTINPYENPNSYFYLYSIPAYDENESPVLSRGQDIKSMKFLVDNESVLISKLNPETSRIWLPFVNENNKAVCSSEFIVYKPRKGINRLFIYCIIKTHAFSVFFSSLVTGSTGSRQRVPPKDTLAYKLAFPRATTIIDGFCDIMDPLFEKRAWNIDQEVLLGRIRESLIPKLMSGKVRVPFQQDNIGAK